MNEIAPSDALVRAQALRKCYGSFVALEGLNLDVHPGTILALLGPNGAGKTTSINLIMGLLEPTSGRATIGGADCFHDRHLTMARIGYVPDEPAFYDYLRGMEIIEFAGEMRGYTPVETRERTAELTQRLDIQEALGEFATNYSRGMKKKLALVVALLHKPDLLILDEPTNGLDPFATATLHDLIREEAARGTAVFFSTHLLDQAERLCHRIAILQKGRLVAEGSLAELSGQLAAGGSLEDVFFEVAGESVTSEST